MAASLGGGTGAQDQMMRSIVEDVSPVRSRATIKPEERLLLAVLESAYWDLQSPDPGKRKTALNYFLDDGEEHAFSFISICQHFSWSATSIRTQLSGMLDSPAVGVEVWAATMPKRAYARA